MALFVGLVFLFPLLWFILALFILVWVYQDAQSRNMNGALWAVIVFFLSVIGLILYLLVRESPHPPPAKPITRVCPKCGQVLDEDAKYCPRCGRALE